ncbi:MAG: class D sortase [Desulfitobacteriaceae bacterium]|nr:class D sortase [Desulfitobacteriaceae bacterium]
MFRFRLNKRWAGILLLCLGLSLAIPYTQQYLTWRWEQYRLTQAWEKLQATQLMPAFPPEDAPIYHIHTTHTPVTSESPKPVPEIKITYPAPIIAKLAVPRLGLNEIVLDGTSLEILQYAPGHLLASPYPGHPGNAVISAHNDLEFHHLDSLQTGDLIYITDSHQKVLTFKVEKTGVLGPKDVLPLQGQQSLLTLSTCYPFNAYRDTPYRYIVTAHLI